MSNWRYDSSKQGLETVFFDYEVEELKYLWGKGAENASSREVNDHVKGKTQISRASVINSLNRMVEDGIMKYTEVSGKGGYRRLYTPVFDEAQMKKHIAEELVQSIKSNLT
ncbi:MAG: BlaI/MecI/CopY family transcriptional regulator [Candidatus Bathyarchaeia archaeon]|jgi:predicted transcriptional regulator